MNYHAKGILNALNNTFRVLVIFVPFFFCLGASSGTDISLHVAPGSPFVVQTGCLRVYSGTVLQSSDSSITTGSQISFSDFNSPAYQACIRSKQDPPLPGPVLATAYHVTLSPRRAGMPRNIPAWIVRPDSMTEQQ